MQYKFLLQMNKELKESTDLGHALDIIKKYYDVENCKPPAIVKSIFIAKLQEGLDKTLKCKARKQFL